MPRIPHNRDMSDERPTMPPTSCDTEALAFARKLATLERTRRRTESGLLRALSEGWAARRETDPK